jgi:hypothetical protein
MIYEWDGKHNYYEISGEMILEWQRVTSSNEQLTKDRADVSNVINAALKAQGSLTRLRKCLKIRYVLFRLGSFTLFYRLLKISIERRYPCDSSEFIFRVG